MIYLYHKAGGVESSNKESFEPEQQHFPSHLIPGTQHPSSTVTVTLTQSEDGTYFPPPHLIDELDAWELGGPPSLTINTLAPPSSGQLLLEIATESTSDGFFRTGASNEAASELPVPVNGTKYRVQQQLQLSSIQHRRHLVKPDELTTMTASNPSSFLPVTLSETQVLISSTSPPVSVVTIRSETPELPTPETGQWGTENGVLASSDSASASIFKEQKRKKCVESETSTKTKTRCFKKCCLNDTAEVNKNT
ncbi:uncharacterized protein LOC124202949 [Daphnia pulex]|uniref:uncharacterized protein LOC124202949 n=1 Tax=Daphnia pulex TaxID=6669 RepID=UPI001EDDA1E3|nr:uncharacterized protein LOC124202949 [Daphnia pulex]